jgi:hypothetical protein
VLAVVMLAFTVLTAGVVIHWILERKRLAARGAEWAVIGPRWTSTR